VSRVDELRRSITTTHERFMQALEGLDVAVLETEPALGVWPVREIAGHLAAWNEVILDELDIIVDGGRSDRSPIEDFNAFNAQSAEQTRSQSWHEVSERLDATIHRAERLADRIVSVQLDQPVAFPWGGSGTLLQLVRGINGHEEEHIDELQPWLASRARKSTR
jgi:hypothetical protein